VNWSAMTIVIGMIRNMMEAHNDAKGFIFDGFPRTAPKRRPWTKC
jgi:adenylate kinase